MPMPPLPVAPWAPPQCADPGWPAVQLLFQLHPTTELSRLFEVYSGVSGLPLADIKFELAGQRLLGSDTPRSRNIVCGMAMAVVPLVQPKAQDPLRAEEGAPREGLPDGPEDPLLQCSERMEA